MAITAGTRRLPIGAEVQERGGVHFRVWAPRPEVVEVVLEAGPGAIGEGKPAVVRLDREEGGYHSALVADAGPGTLYRFRLDGGDAFPDPASRFQPEGPHGPSMVVDPGGFAWRDRSWKGLERRGQVLYEMHVGTFTREGTWRGAAEQLPALAELGVTALEVMPVADFPGRFNWGYDGVDLFAPSRNYGTPDDFRHFVARAHDLGLGVVLDVVYNHFGPAGNYLRSYSERYVSDRYRTEWGDAVNFDGEDSGPVREFFLSNIAYWIDEFHVDGFRFDATQAFIDHSEEHILAACVRRARREAEARGRTALLIGEDEPQRVQNVRPAEQGGFALDAVWVDDFHHAAAVALTGRAEAYLSDYRGSPQEFISALKWGYLYQGQRSSWQKKGRGTPAFGIEPSTFVLYLQNHDQVANSIRGRRIHELASPGLMRAMTALWLLAPATPSIFQGQEFAASSPFLYFGDHEEELARVIREGRLSFLGQFRSLNDPRARAIVPDPADPATFERSKLDHAERDREGHRSAYELHRDLLRLRREDPTFCLGRLDGAVLDREAFVLRYFGREGDDRLLLVNLGGELRLDAAPEPLLAPPEGRRWRVLWSSEDPRYGGNGTPGPEALGTWRLSGRAAVALAPRIVEDRPGAEPDA